MTEQANKKKKTTVAAAVVTALALLFTGTFAWVSTAQSATNQFVKTDYQVVLHDKFDGVDVEDGKSHKVEFDAGDTVNKDIWVENAGSDNILVRVKLTENMSIKQNSGAAQTIGTADAVHNLANSTTPAYGDACADIHSHVTWTSGKVITYSEWSARDGKTAGQEKKGAFWVIAPDGWAYWMQALAPSDPAVTGDSIQPGTTAGHTGLLLDAVKLNESETGHIDYSIKAEMDAIDADLKGLAGTGATWTSTEAQLLASYAGGNAYSQAAAQAKDDANKATAEAESLRQQADELASSPTATEAEKQEAVAKAEAAEQKAENLTGAANAGTAYQEAVAKGDTQESYHQSGLVEAYTQAAENGGTIDTTKTDSAGTPYTTLTDKDGTVHLIWIEVPDDGVVRIPDGIDVVGIDKETGGTNGVFGRDNTKAKKVIVPEGVTTLGVDAISAAPNVESVELPSTLTKICNYGLAFVGTQTANGATVTIPDSVNQLGNCAFKNSYFSTDLIIPKGITKIQNSTFYRINVKSIVLPEGLTAINSAKYSGDFQFAKITGNVVIPSTVTTIAKWSFDNINCDMLYVPDRFKDYDFVNTKNVPQNATVKFYTGSSEGGVQDSQVTSTVVYRDGAVVTE